MSAQKLYSLSSLEKRSIFEQVGNTLNIHPAAIEKDWWVVQTLATIQDMAVSDHILFKGGTSLSKAWNIIERFSEDIDLALDKSFLGIEECNTVKQVKKLRSATRKYIHENFIPELQHLFSESGYTDVRVALNEDEGKNLEPVQISVFYESHVEASTYTRPTIKIEIGSRSLREPFTVRKFNSLVGEHYSTMNFADAPIAVACVNPERTFLEKLFLLHEEFQKPELSIRINRLSRHLYDIEMLRQHGFADIALENQLLYHEIIRHRSIYTKISSVDYNLHQPKTLNPLPPNSLLKSWQKDYERMQQEMIYGDSLSFDALIDRIVALKARINQLDW